MTAPKISADYIAALEYLACLCLASAWNRAAGSTHGYDVLDFAKVSGERGGEDALEIGFWMRARGVRITCACCSTLCRTIWGCRNPENPYWRDVLAKGPPIAILDIVRFARAAGR